MNPQDPLASLHPLREPLSIGWWPPAPGWWVLLIMGVLAVIVLAYLIYKHHRRNAYRRRALRQLDLLLLEYREKGDDKRHLEQLNALLKSVALLAYPRSAVAALHGQSWRTFLNCDLPPAEQLPSAFEDAAYQKCRTDIDLLQVQRAAQHWIKRHRVTP